LRRFAFDGVNDAWGLGKDGKMERHEDNLDGLIGEPGAIYCTKANPELAEELRRFAEGHVWVYENREKLLEQYAEQWVAVKNAQVIGSSSDLDDLLLKIPDHAHTCIEFVTREHLEMIL
jgi:hypothetical protein